MRICDKCKKDIGDTGYQVEKYDFCLKCMVEYQKVCNNLDRQKNKKIQKWLKEECV